MSGKTATRGKMNGMGEGAKGSSSSTTTTTTTRGAGGAAAAAKIRFPSSGQRFSTAGKDRNANVNANMGKRNDSQGAGENDEGEGGSTSSSDENEELERVEFRPSGSKPTTTGGPTSTTTGAGAGGSRATALSSGAGAKRGGVNGSTAATSGSGTTTAGTTRGTSSYSTASGTSGKRPTLMKRPQQQTQQQTTSGGSGSKSFSNSTSTTTTPPSSAEPSRANSRTGSGTGSGSISRSETPRFMHPFQIPTLNDILASTGTNASGLLSSTSIGTSGIGISSTSPYSSGNNTPFVTSTSASASTSPGYYQGGMRTPSTPGSSPSRPGMASLIGNGGDRARSPSFSFGTGTGSSTPAGGASGTTSRDRSRSPGGVLERFRSLSSGITGGGSGGKEKGKGKNVFVPKGVNREEALCRLQQSSERASNLAKESYISRHTPRPRTESAPSSRTGTPLNETGTGTGNGTANGTGAGVGGGKSPSSVGAISPNRTSLSGTFERSLSPLGRNFSSPPSSSTTGTNTTVFSSTSSSNSRAVSAVSTANSTPASTHSSRKNSFGRSGSLTPPPQLLVHPRYANRSNNNGGGELDGGGGGSGFTSPSGSDGIGRLSSPPGTGATATLFQHPRYASRGGGTGTESEESSPLVNSEQRRGSAPGSTTTATTGAFSQQHPRYLNRGFSDGNMMMPDGGSTTIRSPGRMTGSSTLSQHPRYANRAGGGGGSDLDEPDYLGSGTESPLRSRSPAATHARYANRNSLGLEMEDRDAALFGDWPGGGRPDDDGGTEDMGSAGRPGAGVGRMAGAGAGARYASNRASTSTESDSRRRGSIDSNASISAGRPTANNNNNNNTRNTATGYPRTMSSVSRPPLSGSNNSPAAAAAARRDSISRQQQQEAQYARRPSYPTSSNASNPPANGTSSAPASAPPYPAQRFPRAGSISAGGGLPPSATAAGIRDRGQPSEYSMSRNYSTPTRTSSESTRLPGSVQRGGPGGGGGSAETARRVSSAPWTEPAISKARATETLPTSAGGAGAGGRRPSVNGGTGAGAGVGAGRFASAGAGGLARRPSGMMGTGGVARRPSISMTQSRAGAESSAYLNNSSGRGEGSGMQPRRPTAPGPLSPPNQRRLSNAGMNGTSSSNSSDEDGPTTAYGVGLREAIRSPYDSGSASLNNSNPSARPPLPKAGGPFATTATASQQRGSTMPNAAPTRQGPPLSAGNPGGKPGGPVRRMSTSVASQQQTNNSNVLGGRKPVVAPNRTPQQVNIAELLGPSNARSPRVGGHGRYGSLGSVMQSGFGSGGGDGYEEEPSRSDEEEYPFSPTLDDPRYYDDSRISGPRGRGITDSPPFA